MTILNVYVPAEGSTDCADIPKGSAIVGVEPKGSPPYDGIIIYFEGNLYKAENLKRFRERVIIAGGRLTAKYPTVAMRLVAQNELKRIATFDTDVFAFQTIDDVDALRDWTAETLEDVTGVRLPDNCVDWNQAAAAAVHGAPITAGDRGSKKLFRTIAGQFILFDVARRSVEVLPRTDPRCH